jgi:hypothetical protein
VSTLWMWAASHYCAVVHRFFDGLSVLQAWWVEAAKAVVHIQGRVVVEAAVDTIQQSGGAILLVRQ